MLTMVSKAQTIGTHTAEAVRLFEQVQKAQRFLDRAEADLSGWLRLNHDTIDRAEYVRRTTPEGHRCRVDTTNEAPFYPGHPGYVAVCDLCGPAGLPQAFPRDAQAIANRHEEIGGSER